MPYHELGTISPSEDPTVKVQFDVVRRIPDDEYRLIEAASAFTNHYFYRHAFAYLCEKRMRFLALKAEFDEVAPDIGPTWDLQANAFRYRVALTEYVTAMRMFLDHTETDLKRGQSECRMNWGDFNALKQSIFQGNPWYGVAYGLRNYAHQDFAGRPEGSSYLDESDDSLGWFDLVLDRDELLANGDFSQSVRGAFEQMDAEFSATDVVIRSSAAVNELMYSIMVAELPQAQQTTRLLIDLQAEASQGRRIDAIVITREFESWLTGWHYSYVGHHWPGFIASAEAGRFRILGLAEGEIVLRRP